MLFAVDLVLLCFLVPRGTPMSVRIIFLLATLAVLTTLGGAASIGMYQALLQNNGGEEATTLSTTINTLFGLDPEACTRERQRRKTWEEMLSLMDKRPEEDNLSRNKMGKLGSGLDKEEEDGVTSVASPKIPSFST